MMGKPYVRSVSPDTGKVDTKQKDKERIFKMKKKIIISLILAMCCIIASIPASAVENDCVYHKFEHAWCVNSCEDPINITHTYTASSGAQLSCTFSEVFYIEVEYCVECGETRYDTQTHLHRIEGHKCGALNGIVCPLEI